MKFGGWRRRRGWATIKVTYTRCFIGAPIYGDNMTFCHNLDIVKRLIRLLKYFFLSLPEFKSEQSEIYKNMEQEWSSVLTHFVTQLLKSSDFHVLILCEGTDNEHSNYFLLWYAALHCSSSRRCSSSENEENALNIHLTDNKILKWPSSSVQRWNGGMETTIIQAA